jgi:hypothetical protein
VSRTTRGYRPRFSLALTLPRRGSEHGRLSEDRTEQLVPWRALGTRTGRSRDSLGSIPALSDPSDVITDAPFAVLTRVKTTSVQRFFRPPVCRRNRCVRSKDRLTVEHGWSRGLRRAEHAWCNPSGDNLLCCFARNFAVDPIPLPRAGGGRPRRTSAALCSRATGTIARFQGQSRGQSPSHNSLLAVYLQGR